MHEKLDLRSSILKSIFQNGWRRKKNAQKNNDVEDTVKLADLMLGGVGASFQQLQISSANPPDFAVLMVNLGWVS